MNEREEIAELAELATIINDSAVARGEGWVIFGEHAAEDVLTAGYRKPKPVTTAEELDSLPAGSVVLSDPYRYMVHGGADCGWPVAFQRWDDGMWHRGARSGSTHPDNFLPATVLHEGNQP